MYKFCPKCGGELKRENKDLLICQKCNFRFYQNPKPSAVIILETTDEKIILVRRKIEPEKGKLDLPGGFIDLGENAEQAASRELQEELGLSLVRLNYLGSYPGDYLNQEILHPTLNFIFWGKVENPDLLNADDDVSEIILVEKNNIPWDQLAFKNTINALKDYIKL